MLTGGTATILAGGATPAEQKRRVQLLDDSLNAARAALEEGVVAGGGTALIQVAGELDKLADQTSGGIREGVRVLQRSLTAPLACIAENCGLAANDIAARAAEAPRSVRPGTVGRIWRFARPHRRRLVRVEPAAAEGGSTPQAPAALMARHTRSGVAGISLTWTPVAWAMALPQAATSST